MCRIASLYLLQRLKGSMSGDARDFNNIETRDVIKLFSCKTRRRIFQRAKLSTRSITHLCWCDWRTFWKKKAAGRSPRSCTTMPRLTGHLQPRRKWPTWASIALITHPIFWIWPHRTTTCSLDWKNIWKFAIFRHKRCGGHCCRWDLVGRTTFWFFLFEWLAKVRATG